MIGLAVAASLSWQGDYALTCEQAAKAAVASFYERWNTSASSFTASVAQATLRYQGLPSIIQGPDVATNLLNEARTGSRHQPLKIWELEDGLVVAFVELDREGEVLGVHEKGLDVFRLSFDKSPQTCAAKIQVITFGDSV